MTTKGLVGTHIVDVMRCVMIRPLSSPHDLMQLMGRGGRGPNVLESSLEIIWNNSDLSLNVPGRYIELMFLRQTSGGGGGKITTLICFWYHVLFSGMTSDVRHVLDSEGCLAEKLSQLFSYKFVRKGLKCCSNCEQKAI